MSDYRVRVRFERRQRGSRASLAQAAAAALEHEAAKPGGATIVVTDAETLRALNRDYRGLDRPTDVLAFPDGATDPESGLLYYGDVVIAAPMAAEQAARGGHSVAAELRLLTVHGVLHLLGHDHEEAAAEARMWRAQAAVLESLSGEVVLPPRTFA